MRRRGAIALVGVAAAVTAVGVGFGVAHRRGGGRPPIICEFPVAPFVPRRQPSPCAIAGDVVACVGGGELRRTRLGGGVALPPIAVAEPHPLIGAAPGGVVVVAHDLAHGTTRTIWVGVDGVRDVAAEYASTFANAAVAYAPSADRLYVGSASALDVYKVGALVEIAGRGTAWNSDQIATVTGLGDGVVYGEGGGIVRVGPGEQRAAFTSPIGSPVHLAAGADRDHVWATSEGAVALLALAGDAATIVHKVELPGVYHLASVDGAAAVLTVTMKGGAWETLTLTVIGADGAVRWKQVLPTPPRQDASVAGGSGHVAVVLDGALHVFKAADGAAVGP